MDFDWQKFVNPAQFSNANYITELNPSGGMASVRDVAQGQQSQSVPPPENFSELMSQKFAPIQNKIGAIAPAMDQLGQGNVMKAVNTIRQPSNPNVQSGMTQPAPMVGYDYTHGLDF